MSLTIKEQTTSPDNMSRVVGMFSVLTGKSLSTHEGFQFLTLWNMVETQNPIAKEEPALTAAPVATAVTSPVTEIAKVDVISSKTQEVERMPHLEKIEVSPGVVMRKVKELFTTPDKGWHPGYNWRIDVIPFDDDRHDESYFVHFKERPTAEQFAEHYARFTAKENRCKVHVMESDGMHSRRITDEYCSFTERNECNYPSDETLKPRNYWLEGERFRIRFYDQRIGMDNYQYYADKPSTQERNRLSSKRRVAIV